MLMIVQIVTKTFAVLIVSKDCCISSKFTCLGDFSFLPSIMRVSWLYGNIVYAFDWHVHQAVKITSLHVKRFYSKNHKRVLYGEFYFWFNYQGLF